MERTLVLIKPDAMVKKLAGNIISELYSTNLKMIGLKLINVDRKLAEVHYEEHKNKPFFEKLINHLTGKLHNDENVIAIVYEGENAVQKVKQIAGKTNPEQADFNSLRGKYGRINSEIDCFETVVHSSDSPKSGEKEISLWFNPDELIDYF